MPLISAHFFAFDTFRVVNLGYFKNKVHHKLSLPDYFIKNNDSVIYSLDELNQGTKVVSTHLLKSESVPLCISEILSGKDLSNCSSLESSKFSCQTVNLNSGLAVISRNGLAVFRSHKTDKVVYKSRILSGRGSFVCDTSEKAVPYLFDTKKLDYKSEIFLPKIHLDLLNNISVESTPIQNLELSQNDILKSHFIPSKQFLIGKDLIIFGASLFIILLFVGIVCSQKQCLLSRLAKITNPFGARENSTADLSLNNITGDSSSRDNKVISVIEK